jgi:hypothetical protein
VLPGDVHIIVSDHLDDATTKRVQSVYQPVVVRTINKTLDDLTLTCDSLMLNGPFVSAQKVLKQFISLHEVYQDVEHTERQRGVSYD